MNIRLITILFCASALFTACAPRNAWFAPQLISESGQPTRYSITGLTLVSEPFEGAPKPYIEKQALDYCPRGIKYLNYHERKLNRTPPGTWVEWTTVVECK